MRILTNTVLTSLLEEPDDLLPGEQLDAGHCLSVPDGDTDLGWRQSFFGHGDDEISDGPRGVGDPASSSSFEGGHS